MCKNFTCNKFIIWGVKGKQTLALLVSELYCVSIRR